MRKSDLEEFSKKLGLEYNNIDLLKEALTHRSYLNENNTCDSNHNERLEFLGDAILELIISEYLFNTYSDRPEGELTSFRAATVKTETLAQVSRDLGIGEYLLMSKGEETTGGRDKDYLLANVYESILGSIYIDQGYESCKRYVESNLIPRINYIVENRLDIDAKTKFQEIAQNLYKQTPSYRLIEANGPDHEKIFTMAVMVGKKEHGRGEGASKQKAEEQAAQAALESLSKIDKETLIA
jgi:ribonuclease-3